jgi:hypothetical protein
VAMWLGHESPSTTHGYVEADLAMKERALRRALRLDGLHGSDLLRHSAPP